jgi:hypothetical protein
MPSSFWWRLPPLPPQKRRSERSEPGFTDEELQYLESTLSIVSSRGPFIVARDRDCRPDY